MRVYRICKEGYSKDMSGREGLTNDGRWHYKGICILYTSESVEVAKAEKSRHTDVSSDFEDLILVSYQIPDDILIFEITRKMLKGIPWDIEPYSECPGRIVGSILFRSNEFAVVKVPSVVDDESYNFIINPNHPEAHRITIYGTKKILAPLFGPKK